MNGEMFCDRKIQTKNAYVECENEGVRKDTDNGEYLHPAAGVRSITGESTSLFQGFCLV